MTVVVREGGLDLPAVIDLLTFHHREAHEGFPSGFAHALDPAALHSPDIRFFSAWSDGALAGIGAVRALGPHEAEIKSMRTAPEHLGRGVGRAILTRLIVAARAGGHGRVHLETGVGPRFLAANALYERFGFVDRDAFGGYPPSPHNRFMTLELTTSP
ncbi:GNAT family N-acetyltransferase [Sphingomonas bacterium]|uniref:GNAT family N-acetyltransferase n=1 Tax=Sphingomonas bacterium TaxID=1895847 RepID=UPI001576A6D7|nr:GNAT family N-acetyltransferase [Sphingomonas bacterium]